jgi:hypothetical protein
MHRKVRLPQRTQTPNSQAVAPGLHEIGTPRAVSHRGAFPEIIESGWE